MLVLIYCLLVLAQQACAATSIGSEHSNSPVFRLSNLPPELLVLVLSHLEQWHLGIVSRLSRALNDAAYQAGLRLTRTVTVSESESRARGSVQLLSCVVDHIADKKRALNLTVIFECLLTDTSPTLQWALAVVRTALPFVVRLQIKIPADLFPDLPVGLALSAPVLRDLKLEDYTQPFSTRAPRRADAVMCVRADLLRSLSLDIITLGSSWLRGTFPNVVELHLRLDFTGPSVSIQHYFPNLARLFISARVVDSDAQICVPSSLRHLIVDERDRELTAALLASQLSLHTLTTFERICTEQNVSKITVPEGGSKLCGRFELVRPAWVAVSLTLPNSRQCRSVCIAGCDLGDLRVLPIDGLGSSLGSRLVSLTLGSALCSAFLRTPVCLAALTHLVLELENCGVCTWPAADHVCWHGVLCHFYALAQTDVCVRCPVLRDLTVYCEPGRRPPIAVRPDKLARFGRALQLPLRPADARPRLRLVGCVFVGSTMFSGLDKSFSSIEELAFDAALLPPSFEACRWIGYPDRFDHRLPSESFY